MSPRRSSPVTPQPPSSPYASLNSVLATACDAISRRSNGVVILYSVRLRCVERPASTAAALKVSQPRDANLDLSLAVMDVLCDMRRALSFVEIGAVEVESVAVGRAESLRKDVNRPVGWSRAGHVVQCEIVGEHGWRWTKFAKRVAGEGKWEQRDVKKKKAIGEMRKAVGMGERDTVRPAKVEVVEVNARGARSVETKTFDGVEAVEDGEALKEEATAVDALMDEAGIETVSDCPDMLQRLQAGTATADYAYISVAGDDETEGDRGTPVEGLSRAAKMRSPAYLVVRSELHMGPGAARDAEQGTPLAESKSDLKTFMAPAVPIAAISERDQTPFELTSTGSIADKAPVAEMKNVRAKVKLTYLYGPDSEWRSDANHQVVDSEASEASRPRKAVCALADDIRAATSGGVTASVSRGPPKPVIPSPRITPHAQVKRIERTFVALRKSSDVRAPLMLLRLGRNMAALQVEKKKQARERRRITDAARKSAWATRSATSKRRKAAGSVDDPGRHVQVNRKRKANALEMKGITPSASAEKKKRRGFNDSATDTGSGDWRESRASGTSVASSIIEVKKEDIEVDGYSISSSGRFDRSVDSADTEQCGGVDMDEEEEEDDDDDE